MTAVVRRLAAVFAIVAVLVFAALAITSVATATQGSPSGTAVVLADNSEPDDGIGWGAMPAASFGAVWDALFGHQAAAPAKVASYDGIGWG